MVWLAVLRPENMQCVDTYAAAAAHVCEWYA